MTFQLFPYQLRLVEQTIEHLHNYPESAPLIVAPCAAGKSVIIADLCHRFSKLSSGMVLALTHRKELVAQTASKLPAHLDVGVYSAGLGKKELKRITVGGFQSLRKKVEKLPKVGYIIIDEADYATSGYREFIEEVKDRSPALRVIGLTATPYLGDANRTALHLLPENKRIFTGIASEVQIGELLALGRLTPLKPYKAGTQVSTASIKVDARTGDFNAGAVQAAMDVDDLTRKITNEIVDIFIDRNAVMVFCAGVDHTRHVRDALRFRGQTAEMVLGDTPQTERDQIIADFRAGKIKYILGVDVLLVGFDAPIMDGIAVLRPTLSARVHVQALGRGMRVHPGKLDCLVADFVGNADLHGPIDEIEGRPPKLKLGEAPTKICDNCFSICLAGLRLCPTCGYEFPAGEGEAKSQTFDPNTGLLISGIIKNDDGTKTYPVADVQYRIHITKSGAPALVAEYFSEGRNSPVSTEYLNLWHHSTSTVQRDSMKWLRRQANEGGSVPLTAQEALARAEMGALRKPKSVTVKPGSPFPVRFGV